jgi:c(7)-type cytochrome triheme protein
VITAKTSLFSRAIFMQIICICLLYITSVNASAVTESKFVQTFILLGENKSFNAQAALIEQNVADIPQVVEQLIAEAMVDGQKFEERMSLLNLASTIATMHMHWNGDKKPLARLDPIIDKELRLERARMAEVMKWKKQERLLGNFVMKRNAAAMAEKGVAPVLYPHWMHRIYFECKVCHMAIFDIKRWSNEISHTAFDKGELCAECHDGSISFATHDEKSCIRCHVAGQPGAAKLLKPDNVDHDAIRASAERLGAEWRPENLPEGQLPLDRFRMIDWLALKRNGVFKPLVSLDKNYKEEVRDNQILFVGKTDSVDNVLFDHRIHSDWISCSTCHPAIFKAELGGNRVRMMEMARGRFCGHCHGRVSFTFADCKRCHNVPRDVTFESVLHRPHSDQM